MTVLLRQTEYNFDNLGFEHDNDLEIRNGYISHTR